MDFLIVDLRPMEEDYCLSYNVVIFSFAFSYFKNEFNTVLESVYCSMISSYYNSSFNGTDIIDSLTSVSLTLLVFSTLPDIDFFFMCELFFPLLMGVVCLPT